MIGDEIIGFLDTDKPQNRPCLPQPDRFNLMRGLFLLFLALAQETDPSDGE
jgi:hypothetical protein